MSTNTDLPDDESNHLFEQIARDIQTDGYSVNTNALPNLLNNSLWRESQITPPLALQQANIGRNADRALNATVRNDKILWIDQQTRTGTAWIAWADTLRLSLNRSLFLGLHSFESHFALYAPGGFYRRHHDAFHGQSNRLLSVVLYLNQNWVAADAGELVLYTGPNSTTELVVKPELGTLVVFLSEDIAHEVLVTSKDRHSIAGWYRTAPHAIM